MNEKRITVNYNKKPCYEIVIRDTFDTLAAEVENLGFGDRKICIVSDSNVAPLYLETVKAELAKTASCVETYVFPAGEENKNLDVVKKLYEHLILTHFDRKDLLVALGGGVVGDLTGYTAATYLRGIDFVQIPTTVLSQVDSSIGGKTGVDFDAYKNMVGAFHQPRLVYMNLATLNSLPEEQLSSGMGEVLKHGLIKDASYYEWLITNMFEIMDRDMDILAEVIERSCNIKRMVVEKDPTEKGDRASLNFGHTLGHAIEKLMNFTMLHGECVALGSVAAAHISWKRGLLRDDEFFEIRDMNVGFGLPISMTDMNPEDVVAMTKSDKKMDKGQVKFILLKGIGKAYIDTTVTDEEMAEAVDFLIAKDDME